MEEKSLIKEQIISDLNRVLSEMIESEKNSGYYNSLKEEQESLELELTYVDSYKYEVDENKFSLGELNIKKILDAYTIYFNGLNELRYIINNKYKEVKKLFDKEQIDVDNIKTKENIDLLIRIYENKYNKYLEDKKKFLLSIKNFNKDKYEELKNIIESKIIFNDDFISEFRGIGVDNLIDKIYKIFDNYYYTYSSIVLKDNKYGIKRTDTRLDNYLKLLLMEIEDYVKGSYYVFENRLDLNIEKSDDFINNYETIIKRLKEKEKEYKELLNELKNCKNLLLFNEERLFKLLSDIGLNEQTITKEEKDKLKNVEEDRIKELICKERLDARYRNNKQRNILKK